MTRRALLATLAAAFVLDPERLLWKPGAKLISVPAPPFLELGDIVMFQGIQGRFIVTQEARSRLTLGDARFNMLAGPSNEAWRRYGLPMCNLYTTGEFPIIDKVHSSALVRFAPLPLKAT
jgi:hypothetical protein